MGAQKIHFFYIVIIPNDFPKRCLEKKGRIEMPQILHRLNLKANISNSGSRSLLPGFFFFLAVLITSFVPGDEKTVNAIVASSRSQPAEGDGEVIRQF